MLLADSPGWSLEVFRQLTSQINDRPRQNSAYTPSRSSELYPLVDACPHQRVFVKFWW